MRNSISTAIFKKSLLEFVRPSPNNLFNRHSPKGIKYEIRSRLGPFSSFQDTFNLFCDCGCETGTTAHFPRHLPQFFTERKPLSTKLKALILLY